jgi:hypothetical protein
LTNIYCRFSKSQQVCQFLEISLISHHAEYNLPLFMIEKLLPSLYSGPHQSSLMPCVQNLKQLQIISCGFLTCTQLRAIHWSMVCKKCQRHTLIMYALIHSFHKYLLRTFYISDSFLSIDDSSREHIKVCAALNLHF